MTTSETLPYPNNFSGVATFPRYFENLVSLFLVSPPTCRVAPITKPPTATHLRTYTGPVSTRCEPDPPDGRLQSQGPGWAAASTTGTSREQPRTLHRPVAR